MKRTSYSLNHAARLVPLLDAISHEIRERNDAVRILEGKLRTLSKNDRSRSSDSKDLASGVKSNRELAIEAQLATERLELRLARRELTRLGCAIDEEDPLRILIPGEDGDLLRGFVWEIGHAAVQVVPADTLA